MAEQTLPNDYFSTRRRELTDNPGSLGAGSTVHVKDFYGNLETWVVETYRVDGADTVLLQRTKSDGFDRLVLPPEITATLRRQQDGNERRARRRGARQAVETKRAKGQPIGNLAALANGRRRRGAK
jgi:hypothetical protein